MTNKKYLTEEEVIKLIKDNLHEEEKSKYRTFNITSNMILIAFLIVSIVFDIVNVL